LRETARLVVANWVEKMKTSRITFTLPVLNGARCVAFLVNGADKAPILREVLEGNAPGEKYPSKLVQPSDGKLIWFVDRAAASELAPAA
jgi:6-phosphogluconolactonase